jgi:hypothetical protein
LAHQLQLLLQRDLVGLRLAKGAAEDVAQLLDHTGGLGVLGVPYQDSDGVEAIEEKVWIETGLQRRQPRAGQLLGEPRYLHLVRARLLEIAHGMFDAHHRQIDRHPNGRVMKSQLMNCRPTPPSIDGGSMRALRIVPTPAQAVQKSREHATCKAMRRRRCGRAIGQRRARRKTAGVSRA